MRAQGTFALIFQMASSSIGRKAVGASAEEIDIRPAALQLLADLKHPFASGQPVHDVTFENVQAGLRTDYLFRLANRHNAMVVGTGDLSEIALVGPPTGLATTCQITTSTRLCRKH